MEPPTGEVGSSQVGFAEHGSGERRGGEARGPRPAVEDLGASQIRPLEAALGKIHALEPRPAQPSAAKARAAEVEERRILPSRDPPVSQIGALQPEAHESRYGMILLDRAERIRQGQ